MIFKKKFKDWSLTWKFTFGFFVFFFIPILLLGSFAIFQMNQAVTRQSNEATSRTLNTIESRLVTVMEDIESTSTYMIFSNDFRSAMTLPKSEENKERFDRLTESLKGFMAFHLLSGDTINSVQLVGMNGYRLEIGEPVSGNETEWNRLAEEKKGGIVWSSSYPIDGAWHGKRNAISLFRVINDINEINRPIGRVTIRVEERKLHDILAGVLRKEQGSAFIVNNKGTVISHSETKYIGKQHPDWKAFGKFVQSYTLTSINYSNEGIDYLVNSRRLADTDWYLVTMIKQEELLKDLRGLRITLYVTVLLLGLLGILAIMVFYNQIISPILSLTSFTRKVEEGDFTPSLNMKTKDEIGELGNRFNKMVHRLNRLIETRYKLTIKQRESELKNLQSQINPHFLYNTLDMIRWTARIEKAFETSELIELLSRMFRLSLSKGKLWVPVQQEFTMIKTYLELQKRRMGNSLTYTVSFEEQIGNYLILNQIIQPLVENSIVHGFKTKRKDCRIQVRAYLNRDEIWIDVIDNGEGLDIEKLKQAKTSTQHGLALKNINERLASAFGEDYKLQFPEFPEEGTWVRLVIPRIEGETKARHILNKIGDLHED